MKTLLPENLTFSDSPRIAIVGGGISGLMSAFMLQKAGAEVTVFDRQQMGKEASWAGGGIVSPMYPWRYPDEVNALASVSQQHFPALATYLTEQTGIDPELQTSGMLMLDGEDAFQAEAWCQHWQKKLEVLAPEYLNLLNPRLETKETLALWMPEIQQVRNPRLMKSLKAMVIQLGVALVENCPIEGLLLEEGMVKGVLTPSQSETQQAFDQVVLTLGAWTPQLLPQAEIYPVKGQMLLIDAPEGFLKQMVMEKSRYLIPRKDGRILVGSTVEEAGFDKSTTVEAEAELKAFAYRRFPELAMFELETHWAGLRPGKQDAIPYISQHPKWSNVFVNAGHFRNGVVLSIGSAQLLTKIMTQQATESEQAPYRLV